jgi:hypothetical protein
VTVHPDADIVAMVDRRMAELLAQLYREYLAAELLGDLDGWTPTGILTAPAPTPARWRASWRVLAEARAAAARPPAPERVAIAPGLLA